MFFVPGQELSPVEKRPPIPAQREGCEIDEESEKVVQLPPIMTVEQRTHSLSYIPPLVYSSQELVCNNE